MYIYILYILYVWACGTSDLLIVVGGRLGESTFMKQAVLV